MGTKYYKQLVGFLEANGWEYSRTNTKSFEVYECPERQAVLVATGISEQAATTVQRKLQKQLGLVRQGDKSKRSADVVKARRVAERSRAVEAAARTSAEIEALIRKRQTRLDGLGGLVSDRELDDVSRLIEQKQRELREWRRLMTEVPDGQ